MFSLPDTLELLDFEMAGPSFEAYDLAEAIVCSTMGEFFFQFVPGTLSVNHVFKQNYLNRLMCRGSCSVVCTRANRARTKHQSQMMCFPLYQGYKTDPPPDFRQTFIRHYLEHKAELAGQDPKSVMQQEVDKYNGWVTLCIQVSGFHELVCQNQSIKRKVHDTAFVRFCDALQKLFGFRQADAMSRKSACFCAHNVSRLASAQDGDVGSTWGLVLLLHQG